MINLLCCLILAATSGVVIVSGFPFEGALGFLFAAIFSLSQLSQSSKEEIF